ncbi:MAG: peptidylprolyl isomerase [bacterium]
MQNTNAIHYIQILKGKGTRKKTYFLCPLFYINRCSFVIFCFLISYLFLSFSFAEEPSNSLNETSEETPSTQTNNKNDEEKHIRKVSITAGPNGKVVWLFDRNLGSAYGNATVLYEDVTLTADSMWADMDAEIIEASGNVNLKMKDQVLMADHLLFDLKNKKGILTDGLNIDEPWFYYGGKMSRLNEKESFIEDGAMTSCNLNNPHYLFEASKIVVHLRKELVAKNVIFKIGGIPLLYLPVYRRSLEPDKRARFIFKIGSSSFEGYYVKNILPIRWRMLDGNIFFNYTSRRGINSGTEFDYNADKVRLREIFIPVPEDASNEEWQEARKNIEEIFQRSKGQLDKIWLKQIYIKYQISELDKQKARERAEKVLAECKKENADFSQQARRWSDDKETKSNGGDLGYFILDETGIRREESTSLYSDSIQKKAIKPKMLPIIEFASKLDPGNISDLIETDEGYHIVKLESKDRQRFRVRHIFIMFEPSEKAQKDAQSKVDELLTKLSSGTSFEDVARLYSDDTQTKEKGGDLGWVPFQDLDLSFHSVVRNLDKGSISRPIIGSDGIYILKLEDREKTPDFADLARQYSKSPNAEQGGDTGYISKWEMPPEVRREAFRMDIYDISKPIKTKDGYRIVKMEKKRKLGGDIYLQYGDLYSYQIEKNPIKIGQTWDVNIRHNQILWRGSEWEEYDPRYGQERLRRDRLLEMRAELRLTGEEFKQVYQSYSPERELKSYWALDYYWTSKTRSSGHARFIIDGTRDLLGQDTNILQKYPEISYRPPDYRLYEIKPFKKVNSYLHYIANRIQGKSTFPTMARKFSDDERTREKGGELGWLDKQQSGLNSKVESIIFDPNEIDKDDISRPIYTTEGYYIIKVEDVEEKAGKRERVKVRQIFIAIDPDIRTKDEASKISDEIYRKLVEGERPALGFPTLDNTSFSFNFDTGNYFKDIYYNENNIWLQTASTSVSLGKRAILKLGITREINFDFNGDYRLVWHSKTRPVREIDIEEGLIGWEIGERDWNVLSDTWSFRASSSSDLHRVFFPSFIPKVYALKHTFSPYARFSYAPPTESEEGKKPPLYPFGPGTWSYKQKRLSFGMTNSIDIKTKFKRERINILRWDLSGGVDYIRKPGDKYEYLRNTFSVEPYKQLSFNNVLEHDLNNIGTNESTLTRFSTNLRYYNADGKWSGTISRSYLYYYKRPKQLFRGAINLNWSRTWNLRFDLEYEYDKKIKDISDITLSLQRNLHCWESRVGFSRRGTKGGYIRKDFFFSINIAADPGKSLGLGYDDIDKSWTLQSLPGMGSLGRYIGSRYIGY